MLIDTHNHLYFDAFDADRDSVLARMAEAGVLGAVLISIDPASCSKANALARLQAEVRAAAQSWAKLITDEAVVAAPAVRLDYSVGLHPTSSFEAQYFAPDGSFDATAYLAPWWDDPAVHGGLPPIAIGECGVDLYWDSNPLSPQQAVFRAQLEFARERDLPLIIHTRSADQETLDVLQSVPGARGIFHCFNGSPLLLDFALRDFAADGGWYISFAGNLTNGDRRLEDAARRAPLERLLVETDAPFMTPKAVRDLHPKGSKPRCEPAHVAHTAACLASLRGIALGELSPLLAANSERCFGVNWQTR